MPRAVAERIDIKKGTRFLGKLKREGTKREKIAKGSSESKAKRYKEDKVYVVV
jgi:hypothetical protein